LARSNGLGREYGAEDGYSYVKGLAADAFQIGGIALRDKAGHWGPPDPGIHEVSGDIDSDDFRAKMAPSPHPRFISIIAD
jgi:hypothetical protein